MPGCVFVAGIHPSRSWMSASFKSMWWNVYMCAQTGPRFIILSSKSVVVVVVVLLCFVLFLFFVHMSSIIMIYVVCHVCLAGCIARQELLYWILLAKLFDQIFDLYHFVPHWLQLRITRSSKCKTSLVIFWHFSADQDDSFDMVFNKYM